MLKLTTTKPIKQVLGIGLLAGMRSAIAPVITGYILSEHRNSPGHNLPVDRFSRIDIANVLKLLAVGEFIADKLPFTPNRTRPVSVAVRCLSGALAGAGIYSATGKKPLNGLLLGCVAAGVSTIGSFYLRKALAKVGLGNVLSGLIEDVFVVSAGVKLARS